MRRCVRLLALLALALSVLTSSTSWAAKHTAAFALVIGVNRSVEQDLPRLRYADDDAARYFELFRLLGAKTYLLTRFDAASRRVHVQAAAEAELPRNQVLQRTVRQLARDVATARARGVRTLLYVAYAGHGKVGPNGSYITLEDARLDGRALARSVVAAVGAHASHLIVDACNSYLLAMGRGPGGTHRPIHDGFSRLAGTLLAPQVGLLLSTSSGRESHEWQGFQAGVFSHAVRSGLYGAADADGDGRVSYREIAAFVEQAHRSIANEKYRSRVFAHQPASTDVLVDLRARQDSGIEIGPAQHGRYLLEDTRGVRLLDFHSGSGQRVRLVRPAGQLLYLRRLPGEVEYAIPPGAKRAELAALTPQQPRAAVRGAAEHAFARLFELPFGPATVQRYRPAPPPTASELTVRRAETSRRGTSRRRIAAWSTLALSVAAVAAGAGCTASAVALQAEAPAQESNAERLSRNSAISRRNIAAVTLYAVGGAAAATGLLLFLWPEATHARRPVGAVGVQPGGLSLGLSGTF